MDGDRAAPCVIAETACSRKRFLLPFPCSAAPARASKMNIESAKSDILATEDLLERALKLSGLVTTLFAEQGYRLVVVGGSAVEFYTEGGYMSGDIDFCRFLSRPIPPRLRSLPRNWRSWKGCWAPTIPLRRKKRPSSRKR